MIINEFMPKYTPSIPIQDCYGSVGELTYYHKDGRCFYRKRSRPVFPGTMLQMEHQEVHLRAIAAWQALDSSVQKEWNAISPAVIVHRPPFDNKAHMSGYNLFPWAMSMCRNRCPGSRSLVMPWNLSTLPG